jgi:NAD(P)-dependent dehydrogenase (short-subunit alcohol dehydrogenase family)
MWRVRTTSRRAPRRLPVTEANLAVVAGATGTIGSAVVRRLRSRGLDVLAVARTADGLAALEGVRTCVADIATDDAIATIRAAVDAPVRMAVCCVGLPVRGSAETIDPRMLGVGVDVKAGGLLRLIRAVGDHLVHGSRIVTFAGSLGLEPRATEAGPGAVNAAVFNLMRQLSLIYGPRGITTHTISPGPADTPRLRSIATAVSDESGRPFDEVWADYASGNSLGRLPSADEIAWGVELLLAPEADLLHGSVLYLDAGGHRGIH